MIEIGEKYYLINKEEITSDMVLLTDGIYISGENFYEVIDNKNDNFAASQNSNKNQTSTVLSNKYLNIFFIFSVLLLSFTVLCIYIGINNIVNYEEIINQSNQFGAVGETVIEQTSNLLRNGVLWIIGGVASLLVGGFLSLIYHSKK